MVCETKDGNPQTDRTFAHLEIVGRLNQKKGLETFGARANLFADYYKHL
jgi:hypothetical protein